MIFYNIARYVTRVYQHIGALCFFNQEPQTPDLRSLAEEAVAVYKLFLKKHGLVEVPD
jgi:hypothetical protein